MSYDDIESDDAMALLSRPDDLTRTGLSRRRFLQAMAMGAGGALLGSSLVPHEWRDAWGATPIGANDGILVLIDLAGGNDGLNTVVPYTNATYYAKRGALGITPDRVVRLTADLSMSIEGRDVIIVEDVIDSGRTISYLRRNLATRHPRSLALCVLLDKVSRREVDVEVDYVGFVVPDEFVVGYGLDYDGWHRNLPDLAVLESPAGA